VVLLIRLIKESFIFAYSSVIVNKLRTFLTLLGITIGIFAIISVFTIVDSLNANVRKTISGLSNDVVYVQKWPWGFDSDYPWWEYLKRPETKVNEYKELKQRSQLAEAVCYYARASKTIKQGNNYVENTSILLVSEEYYSIKPCDIETGRFFTQTESEFGKNCCVIGYEIAKKLFENQNPIGKELKMKGFRLQVVGVVKKAGKGAFGEGSVDEQMFIPMNFGRRIFDLDNIQPAIWAKAKAGVSIVDLQDELKFLMRSIRRIKPLEKDNFALNQASVITKVFDSFFAALNIAGWIIGGFSILVGGFGIANIMFVSVKERTNIIGIQKAVGAKSYIILVQFLFESVILSITGGLIGLLLVFTGTLFVSNSDFSISLTMGNIMLGLFVSGTIGIISGFAPAWSASRLNPVEAINSHF
jgi:putative ABC transport system permease protein